MKKIVFSAIISFLLMFTTSCASAPDEVKEDIKNYNSTSDEEVNNGFSYIELSNLNDDIKSALKQDYTQFKLADNISYDAPSEIGCITFKQADDFQNKYKQIFEMFFDKQTLGNQKIVLNNGDDGSISNLFDNEKDKVYACAGDNGFIAMLKQSAYDKSFSCDGENVKIFHADRNDDLNQSYELSNGSCKIGDAVKYINDWLNNEYKKFDPDYDYKVKTIIVRKNNDKYMYDINAEKYYKGVPLDSLIQTSVTDEDTQRYKMQFVTNSIDIQMLNKDEISSFTNGNGIIIPQKTEAVDKCISLSSALKFCESKFTEFKDVTINDIGIKYVLTPDYDFIGTSTKLPDGTINNKAQTSYDAGITINSRPVWEFVIDVNPSEFADAGNGEATTHGDVRKYIYIDIVTGELFFELDPQLLIQ